MNAVKEQKNNHEVLKNAYLFYNVEYNFISDHEFKKKQLARHD
tara:strand:- start:10737 stop:10865 length:129 start_codon:yes stop_codon:yes gene_type:complete